MLWKNTADRFGHVSVLIHWLVALTVYGMFALGLWMVTLGYYDVWYHRAPEIHKSIGALLFIVMVIRVIWRFVPPPPKPLASYGRLTRVSAIRASGAVRRSVRHSDQRLSDLDRRRPTDQRIRLVRRARHRDRHGGASRYRRRHSPLPARAVVVFLGTARAGRA